MVAWTLENASETTASLTVNLMTAPLRLHRQVSLDGPNLDVTDTVHNLSPDPVEFMWVQHPAFGAPFVDEHARIDTGASTFISDPAAPGTVLPADAVFDFPRATDITGAAVDLRVVPGEDEAREVFGALTDFEDTWFSITSPTAGFGVRMEWDPDAYPHAWFWQECHASKGFPWFRRAYAIAIEPANVLPRFRSDRTLGTRPLDTPGRRPIPSHATPLSPHCVARREPVMTAPPRFRLHPDLRRAAMSSRSVRDRCDLGVDPLE